MEQSSALSRGAGSAPPEPPPVTASWVGGNLAIALPSYRRCQVLFHEFPPMVLVCACCDARVCVSWIVALLVFPPIIARSLFCLCSLVYRQCPKFSYSSTSSSVCSYSSSSPSSSSSSWISFSVTVFSDLRRRNAMIFQDDYAKHP